MTWAGISFENRLHLTQFFMIFVTRLFPLGIQYSSHLVFKVSCPPPWRVASWKCCSIKLAKFEMALTRNGNASSSRKLPLESRPPTLMVSVSVSKNGQILNNLFVLGNSFCACWRLYSSWKCVVWWEMRKCYFACCSICDVIWLKYLSFLNLEMAILNVAIIRNSLCNVE